VSRGFPLTMNISEPTILVWDTNGIDAIVRGIVHRINNTGEPGSPPNRREEFLAVFGIVFDGFRDRLQCANHTSDRVFADEVNPQLVGCHLRNGHPLVETYCAQIEFINRWGATIEEKIPAEIAEDIEIEDMRHLMEEDVGRKDASLVVVALKLGNESERPTMIVTDDSKLAEQIINLRNRYEIVEVGGSQYQTRFVATSFSIQLLRELHLSCGIDNDTWHHIMMSFKRHHNGRYEEAARGHDRRVIEFFATFHDDCEEKARRAITREMEQAFGVNDG